MLALRNGSHHEECLCCWRELVLLDGLGDVALDGRTYNLALSSTVKAERWEEMEAIFDMMQVGMDLCSRLLVVVIGGVGVVVFCLVAAASLVLQLLLMLWCCCSFLLLCIILLCMRMAGLWLPKNDSSRRRRRTLVHHKPKSLGFPWITVLYCKGRVRAYFPGGRLSAAITPTVAARPPF